MREGLMSRLLLAAILLLPAAASAQLRFQEGRHFSVVPTPQATGLAPAGRIEVTEIFSYACGGCYQSQPVVEALAAALPADAVMTYVHASMGHDDWRVLQRAHATAQLLGLAERNHARLFTAIWETGEFPFHDRTTGRPRRPTPDIRELARFYAQGGGVTEAAFVAKATSKEADAAVQRNDALVRGWQVGSTPGFVVAGRYRIENDSLRSTEDLIGLVNYLVSRERGRLRSAAAARD